MSCHLVNAFVFLRLSGIIRYSQIPAQYEIRQWATHTPPPKSYVLGWANTHATPHTHARASESALESAGNFVVCVDPTSGHIYPKR